MTVNERPITTRQWSVLVLVLAALVIDGIDTQLLALVAPLVMGELHVDKASFGPAMSAALFGMAVGAALGGGLGDRFGRRTVLIGATLLFGLATFGVSVAHGLPLLVVLRLLSGLGFGAVAPVGAALVSEWLPIRIRASVMALLSITIPMGGLIGGALVLWLLPIVGWRGCFLTCGVATLAMVGVMLLALPESPEYVAIRSGGPAPRTMRADSVFTRANLRLNVGAWLAFFSLQLVAYGFLSWAPVFLTMVGWPLTSAIKSTLVFNLAAVSASIIAGVLLMRLRFSVIAMGGALGAAIALVVLYGLIMHDSSEVAVLAAVAAVSVLAGCGITSVYALLAFGYPASCRASGIGMGLMTGRAGGIAIAFTGGALLAIPGDGLTPFFIVLLIAALAAAVGVLILGPRYAGKLGSFSQVTPGKGASVPSSAFRPGTAG